MLVVKGMDHSKTKKEWTKQNFVAKYGREKIAVSKIPHGKSYGQPVLKTTIQKFIASWTQPVLKGAQPYLFDGGQLFTKSVPLRRDIGDPNLIFNLTNHNIYLFQFYLGPQGSGAQSHFHGDAINGLVYGRKRWTFVPPPHGTFTVQDIVDESKTKSSMYMYTVVQRSGDVLYVPEYWSHATENLGENIGVAFEFY